MGQDSALRDTTGGTRVEQELRARVRQQAAIADLGQRALARTELPALMDEAVAVVARTLDVEYSKILELLPDGRALLLRAGVGWKDGGVGHATVGAGRDSQAGYTLRSRAPVIVQDLRTETRFSGPPLLNDHGVVSGMSVIIHGHGSAGPYGVLGAHTTSLRTFTPDDVHFLRAVANILAMAIERRAAEEGLRESEARYRILVETTDEVIYRVATTEQEPAGGAVQFVSSQVERILGYRPDEFMEDPGFWLRILHPDDRRAVMEATVKILAGRTPATRQYRLRHKETGEYRWLEDRVVPQTDEHGKVIAIQGAARDVTERKRAEETAAVVAGLSRDMAGTLDRDEVADRVAAAALHTLRVRRAVFFRLDPAAGQLVFVAIAGEGGTGEWLGRTIPVGKGLAGRAVAEGRPIWLSDVLADPQANLPEEVSRRIREDGLRAVISVPLTTKGRALGALLLRDRTGRVFSDEDLRILSVFADQAALALDNARLYEEAHRQRREAEIVAELARGINASLDLDTVLERVAAGARELCAGDGAAIALREAGSEAAVIRYHAGTRYRGYGTLPIEPGRGLGGQTLLSGRPARTDNYAEDPRVPADYRAAIREEALLATVVVPIRLGERVEGLLYVGRRSPRPFTDQDEALLLRLADQAGIAIQNAHLFHETRGQLKETETLLAVGRTLSLNVPAWEAIRQTAREVAGAFEADMVGVYALDAGQETLVPIAGYRVPKDRLDTLAGTPFPIARLPFLQEAWATRRAVWTADYRSDPRFDQDFLGALRPRSLLFAPTQVGGEIVGGLFLVWWSRERTQTPAELRLVEGVAGLVGQALERARAEDALRQSEERFRGAFEHSGIGRSLQALDGRYLRVNRTLCEMLGYSEPELLAMRWQDVTDPSDVAVDLDLEAKLLAGEVHSYQIEKRYIHKRGHVLLAAVSVSLVRDSGRRPLHFVSEAQDITPRKHAEEALRRHHERLRTLHEIDQAILAARSPETIAQAALRGIRQVVRCERASVVLFDFEAHEVVTFAVEITGETRLRAGSRFPLETFFDLESLRTGAVSVVQDILAIPTPSGALAILMAEGIRSCVAVPLLSQGALIGALNLAARLPGAFLTEQTDIAREVAGSLAVAIQDARLFAQVRAGRGRLQALSRRLVEVQEAERRHLARELHDEIGQVLTGLKLALDVRGGSPAHRGQAAFEEARNLVGDLIVRVRDLSLQLRPAMLDDLGLVPALLWLFERYTAQTRLAVKFEQRGLERRFPADLETAAYRIVQEALTNVARHAGVREVTVRVWVDEDALHAQVEDRGAGFDARGLGVAGSSSGLVGMRERAELLGGRLTVDSAPGAGTRLWAELPLADRLDRRERKESGDDHRPRG